MKKKILFVYNEPPLPASGGNIRVFNLIRELAAKKQYDITLLILPKSRNNEDIKKLRQELVSVEIIVAETHLLDMLSLPLKEKIDWCLNRYFLLRIKKILGMQSKIIKQHLQQVYCLNRALKRLLNARSFDVIQVEHFYLADCISGIKSGSRKILDFHNVHSVMNFEQRKIQHEEMIAAKHFDGALVCSEKEREHAINSGFRKVYVIPNGVDTEYFSFKKNNAADRVLFVGNFSYEPNREGLAWFLKKIMPFIPASMKINIIGEGSESRVFRRAADGRAELHGFVPDFRKYTENSIFVCPLKSGGGTRLKLLMAASSGMPIITTTKGAEGINLRNGKEALFADTPADFISAINKLSDEKFRNNMTKKARYLAERNYSWKRIGNVHASALAIYLAEKHEADYNDLSYIQRKLDRFEGLIGLFLKMISKRLYARVKNIRVNIGRSKHKKK